MSSNNINEQNFSSEDLAGVMSGSGGGPRMGGGAPANGYGWWPPNGYYGSRRIELFCRSEKRTNPNTFNWLKL
jgi:hypothetical protein